MDMLLKNMENYARENKVPIINSQGADLLVETVKTYRPSSVLEIGTAIGYSTLLIARNSPSAKIISIEIDPDRVAQADTFIRQAGLSDQVDIVVGDANQVISTLNTKFDMVFIDAAKGQYLNYLVKVMEKLNDNAVIFTDNVLFRGMVEGDIETPRRYRTIVKRLREFLEFIHQDSRFSTSLYRSGDGIAISIYQGAKVFEKT
ncbi:MAG: O-methyltransferase [Veillonellaceae bacterium]|nr:O-methyltransferase [Veillonellaceae bacterium]